MSLSIVTSFYNKYDRFLNVWIDAILLSSKLPDEVVMNVSGNDFDITNLQNVLHKLKNVVAYKIIYTEHHSMGRARNNAVRAATSDWIMYLNVDDLVTPNCFKDIYDNLPIKEDVLTGSMAWVNYPKGDKIRVYNSTTDDILHGTTNDHSVYRKSMWRKSYYIEYSGDVDVAFWIGLVQVGAKFKYIPNVLTTHYFRPDTVFGKYSKEDMTEIRNMMVLWREHGVHNSMFDNAKYRIKGDYGFTHKTDILNLSIIIAYKQSDSIREKQKKYTLERYKMMLPKAQIILSESKTKGKAEWENFCKSKQINDGVRKATRDYLLITDIDVVLSKQDILDAINSLNKHCCVIPYIVLYKLNDKESMLIYENTPKADMPKPDLTRAEKILVNDRYQGVTVVRRVDFIKAGGYDERFIGWGSEDGAFLKALQTITEKPILRYKGTAFHLNHKTVENRLKMRDKNSGVYVREYNEAMNDKIKMLELLKKRGMFL